MDRKQKEEEEEEEEEEERNLKRLPRYAIKEEIWLGLQE